MACLFQNLSSKNQQQSKVTILITLGEKKGEMELILGVFHKVELVQVAS